ncbi:MAG: hypothetical protein HGA85_05050 [Nanoarchaeota archaeon]|nr:hypothetical protein [Nanoarchaeota archaeon]
MSYNASSEYDSSSVYVSDSIPIKRRYAAIGACRGTCRTGYGCSCK